MAYDARLSCALAGVLAIVLPPAVAQQQADVGIYTCIDDQGRRLTADRPIPQCSHKEQRVLNRDGSLKAVVPPTLTADERAAKEARERREAEVRAARADAVRRDRNLMLRYPTEEAHYKAREAALDTVRQATRVSEARLKELSAERRPLLNETEFYAGKPLPPRLKQQLDANDAAADAQRAAMSTQEAEIVRINKLYDEELDRLRRLWSGTPPGSMGPLAGPQAVTTPTAPASAR